MSSGPVGTGAEPLLALRSLVVGYDAGPVVHGVDLEVRPGEVVALLGPNGAGKTTTLLAASGLLAPASGEIELFGEVVASGGSRARRGDVGARSRSGLGHVPEDRSLFPGLTVGEHLSLGVGRGHGGGGRGARRAALARGLELFPALAPLVDRTAGLLSGGEQQMLAIARALVSRPRLVMIDELSLGLAPRIVADLLPVLRRVADEEGTGFLLVEQHVALVLGVADRAVVLVGGEVRLAAPAAELRDDPGSLAAAYLG